MTGRDSAEAESDEHHQHHHASTTTRPQHELEVGDGGGVAGMSLHNNNGGRNNYTNRAASPHPTPLFERIVTEEFQEFKSVMRMMEQQNKEIAELKRIQADLEVRLQLESRERERLEHILEAKERAWERQFAELEQDRNHWKDEVQKEQAKNAKLIDQVVRKDQDIHRMLQRKYDQQSGATHGSIRNVRQPAAAERSDRPFAASSRSPDTAVGMHKSPHEVLLQRGSAETVRVRNAHDLLSDFFAI